MGHVGRMKVIVYYKTGCPWATEVMEFLDDQELPYDARDISKNEAFRREMEEKSGQSKSPTLDIDGEILADTDVDKASAYLESHGVEK